MGCIVDDLDDKLKGKDSRRRQVLDIWVVSWTAIDCCLLIIAREYPWPALAIALLTLTDSLYALVYLMLQWRRPYSSARSIALDAVRYLQIIVVFAIIYLSLQTTRTTDMGFCDSKGNSEILEWDSAFYFSAINATTVGDGNTTPCGNWSKPLLILELFCIVALVGIDIPRIISTSSGKHDRRYCDPFRNESQKQSSD